MTTFRILYNLERFFVNLEHHFVNLEHHFVNLEHYFVNLELDTLWASMVEEIGMPWSNIVGKSSSW